MSGKDKVSCRIVESWYNDDFSGRLLSRLLHRGFEAKLDVKRWPVSDYKCGYRALHCHLVGLSLLHDTQDGSPSLSKLVFDEVPPDVFESLVMQILKNQARGVFAPLSLDDQSQLRSGQGVRAKINLMCS